MEMAEALAAARKAIGSLETYHQVELNVAVAKITGE